jgi:hypothetical protein
VGGREQLSWAGDGPNKFCGTIDTGNVGDRLCHWLLRSIYIFKMSHYPDCKVNKAGVTRSLGVGFTLKFCLDESMLPDAEMALRRAHTFRYLDGSLTYQS